MTPVSAPPAPSLAAAPPVRHTTTVSTPKWRARVLPPDQADRLRQLGGPMALVTDADLPDWSASAILLAVEEVETGRLVGYWPVWRAAHAEPCYLDPAVRHNPAVAAALLEGLTTVLREVGIAQVYALIHTVDLAVNGPLAAKLGFIRAEGDVYLWQVPDGEAATPAAPPAQE